MLNLINTLKPPGSLVSLYVSASVNVRYTTSPMPKTLSQAKGFMAFIKQYNVVPVAIAFVLATAVSGIIDKIVSGLITPLIGLVNPTQSLADLSYTVRGQQFMVGQVIDAVINFLIIALVVYVAAKVIFKDDSMLEKK